MHLQIHYAIFNHHKQLWQVGKLANVIKKKLECVISFDIGPKILNNCISQKKTT